MFVKYDKKEPAFPGSVFRNIGILAGKEENLPKNPGDVPYLIKFSRENKISNCKTREKANSIRFYRNIRFSTGKQPVSYQVERGQRIRTGKKGQNSDLSMVYWEKRFLPEKMGQTKICRDHS